jgi:two-component system chemotaxis response regulator CheY
MPPTTSLSSLDVLLVEPSSAQTNLVTRMLHHLGIARVQQCDTAGAALAVMRANCPAVVLSSLYLPDMPGTELVEAMRAETALEAVPFILISSETRPQVLEPVRQSGACSIVAKPFDEERLARALHAAADYLNPEIDIDPDEVEKLKVLLVDDSQASRRYLRRLLEELGVERIIEATNGREAVACLQETMVDLVITDYNRPEMDGRELTEYIRSQSWQNEVPILLVTSEQNQGRLAAVQKAGVSAVCDKPFESSGIRQLIAQALVG